MPSLYPNDIDKALFHDNTSSYPTVGQTKAYLEQLKGELGISYIVTKDIPVCTPDASPLGFSSLDILNKIFQKDLPEFWNKIWKLGNSI
jgi:hypothetical protein